MNRLDISRLQKNRIRHLQIGFVLALVFVVLAFRWTVEEKPFIVETAIAEQYDEIPVVRTPHEEQPQLPPPALEATDNIVEAETPDFIEEPLVEPLDFTPVAEAIPENPNPKPAKQPVSPPKPAVAPAPNEEPKEPAIFVIVEEMPRFGDCAQPTMTKAERTACSDKALLTYLSQSIRYPSIARENGIEGTVVVQFVIDENGKIQNPKTIKDIGGGCGKEALRVVQEMPDWIPGMQRGNKVKVQMNLPVRFKLQ